MQHYTTYTSPLGAITLAEEDGALTGLWFDGQKYDRATLAAGAGRADDLPVFEQARGWLDAYFAGTDPGALPPTAPRGTDFQRAVWAELATIPHGTLTTYGALAQSLGEHLGRRCSARAVGTAVGRNPVSVILPCHRVVGASGSLTGYAGGLDRKTALLELEGVDVSALRRPTTGTAL
ncbi:MAG: methylated-DNA--[protein]-cysteine S-methyltransferase [Eggerthellaceae bacterium]|nr:methylated-DNA--[protein]-cysteine S-methyltransferase [Eggerthellaceae bacterium]